MRCLQRCCWLYNFSKSDKISINHVMSTKNVSCKMSSWNIVIFLCPSSTYLKKQSRYLTLWDSCVVPCGRCNVTLRDSLLPHSTNMTHTYQHPRLNACACCTPSPSVSHLSPFLPLPHTHFQPLHNASIHRMLLIYHQVWCHLEKQFFSPSSLVKIIRVVE